MTGRGSKDRDKGKLSLSRSKKKGSNDKAGVSASTTPPITAFFGGQPPPKVACPLCGLLVPRYKINEHIDLQCHNFERGDSSAASASNHGVPSIQLSPSRSLPKSPEKDPNQEKEKEEQEVNETNTSPYFKKNNSQQPPREVNSKSVVRRIDLGSLSSKLSRRAQKTPEKEVPKSCDTQMNSEEALNSSQKENLQIESLEDDRQCSVTVIDLTDSSTDAPAVAQDQSDLGRRLELTASKRSKLSLSSTKLTKRKKESPSSVFDFKKKAKHEVSNREPEEVSAESKAETAELHHLKAEVHAAASADEPPLSAKETQSAAVMTPQPESGADATSRDPPRLPYYLRNFRTVLQAVLENEDDRALFDQQDMSSIHAFEKLSGNVETGYCHFISARPCHLCVCFLSQSWVRSCTSDSFRGS